MDARFALIACLLAPLPPVAAAQDEPPRQDETRGAAPSFTDIDTSSGLSFHRSMFLLPATSSNRYEGSETEAVFRLSAKLRIMRGRLFLAYTQVSFWQAYNDDESRPFRETNHNPELFYRIVPSNSAWKNWGTEFGLSHESNGRGGEASRSWNRVVATVHRVGPRWLASLRLWHRLEEDRCPLGKDGEELEFCEVDAGFDDNPRILDFMGYGELHLRYGWGRDDPQQLHFQVRGNPATGKGGVGLDYSHAAGSPDLHWFAKAWHGYGESLIDHDRSVTRLGIGILLRR